jgi:transmembrane sensor
MRSFVEDSQRSAEDRAEWDKWSSDPMHGLELAHVEDVWETLGDPAAMKRLAAMGRSDGRPASIDMSTWRAGSVHENRPRRMPGFVKFLAAAACLAVVSVSAILQYAPELYHRSAVPELGKSYATEGAQTRIVNLPDGSRITLGARTRLSVRYTRDRRAIQLEHGEALFSVAHNPAQPFVVLAGAGTITAIGTQFDVSRELDSDVDRVTVVVKEGAVEVGPPDSSGANAASPVNVSPPLTWAPARVAKGQEVSYDVGGQTQKVADVDVDVAAAWVDGRLEYRHTPLKIVIPRVSRYNAKSIVVADDAAGQLPFSGIIFVGQIDEFLRALQAAYPVEVLENSDRILIRSRADGVHRDR